MALQNTNLTSSFKRGILKRDSSLGCLYNIEAPASDESGEKRSVRLNVTEHQAIDPICSNEFPSPNELVNMIFIHDNVMLFIPAQ